MKKRLRLEYLNKDKPNPEEEGMEAAGVDVIDVVSGGSRLYGSVLLPDGSYESSRPCVILFHGFPGTARNDDYAQALRRCGCVDTHTAQPRSLGIRRKIPDLSLRGRCGGYRGVGEKPGDL